ncbi:hypothetical protein [Enterobacter asburiae]|uniref:hypothetical protein n=1 Tax=Enterobacter asburiae TaxID=61645 RepID=UPI002FE53CAC
MNRRSLIKSLVGIASITPFGYALAKETNKQVRSRTERPRVVSIADYASLQEACEALRSSNGGIVEVPVGRFFAGEFNGISKYMDINNISIVGTKMPTWNSDASELVGGSVIEGKFNVGAHNFSISDIGFDVGHNVVNRRWPGSDTTTDYPFGGTWDGFAIGQPSQASPLPAWRGFKARNVIGLLNNSATVGHAILIENVNVGCLEGDIIGIYGVHGVVIKSENINGDNLRGYMNKTDCVIFKSDTFAPGGNVQVSNVIAEVNLPNCTPHAPPIVSESGIYFNPELQNYTGPIQIGNARVRDAKYSILGGSSTGTVGADIQISNVDIDSVGGSTEWAIFMANLGDFPRLSFGNVNIKNVKNALYIRYGDANSSGNAQTTIDSLKITNSQSIGVLTDGYAKLKIGSVDMFGVKTAYYQGDNSTLKIGSESLVGVTTKYGNNPYSIGPGWVNVGGGNSTFDVLYSGYEVKLKGLVQAGSGATSLILTLPTYLRPAENLRFIAYKKEGADGTCLIGVSASGLVTLGDTDSVPVTGSYISLDGISWKIKG